MADIFTKSNAQTLLERKNLWFLGDSNMRGLYKDLVWLLEKNRLIELSSLRGKLEGRFLSDHLIKGGALHRGRNFQEIRCYKNFKLQTTIEFVFLTQCLSNDIKQKLIVAQKRKEFPDVILLNSCLWDITRWGPESVEKYKENIVELLKLLKNSLPPHTRVIWITTPPISNEPHGGFFIKQIEFLKHTLRFDVMEANAFVSRIVIQCGFDVLDVHYHLLLQIHRRRPDGIHWTPEAMRHITNLVLTHLCVSWNFCLPGNFKSPLLKKLYPDVDFFKEEKACAGDLTVQMNNALKDIINVKPKKHDDKRGRKRDFNGNMVGRGETERNFSNDSRRKRFKAARRRM